MARLEVSEHVILPSFRENFLAPRIYTSDDFVSMDMLKMSPEVLRTRMDLRTVVAAIAVLLSLRVAANATKEHPCGIIRFWIR